MNKPRIYVLGKPAFKYLEETLAYGLTLSKQLLQTLDLSRGRIYTMLPDGVDIDAIEDYHYGGFTYDYAHRTERIVRVVTIAEHLFASIHSFLNKCDGNPTCIFEDTILEPGDPALKKKRTHYAAFQNHFYFYLNKKHNTLDQIETAVREADWDFPPLGSASMATLADEDASTLESGQLSLDFIRHFAEATEHIIVGAFDGEGYLIWDKVS